MHKSILLLTGSLLAASLAGCVGSGPNTEQGAVAGGALGALAGGIIGNNSRGGDTFGGAILGGAIGALAGGAMGNSVDHEKGTIYGGSPDDYGRRGYRQVTRVAPPAPPAPIAESVPLSPAPNAVWIPGYWSYDGRGYGWAAGHWEVPPPMARAYVSAHWENRPAGYVFVPGYWQ